MKRAASLVFLLTFVVFSSAAQAASDVWYGLQLNVNADGFFHPIVHAIKIEKVFPASPAAAAGLVAGDVIVEIQGLKVDGANADDLKKAMDKKVGETLQIKITHGGKALRNCTLTAARKP